MIPFFSHVAPGTLLSRLLVFEHVMLHNHRNIKTSFKGLADALLEHGPDAPSESKKEEGSGV